VISVTASKRMMKMKNEMHFNDALMKYIQYMKSSDAKASKCHLKFSSLMMIFNKLVYLSSVISLKKSLNL